MRDGGYRRLAIQGDLSIRERSAGQSPNMASIPGILRIPSIILVSRAAAGQPGAQHTRNPADTEYVIFGPVA